MQICCYSTLRFFLEGHSKAGFLPPPKFWYLRDTGSAESRQTQTAHTRGKECGTGTHTQQTEIMQSLPLCTRSPPMYDIRIHLYYYTLIHTHTYTRAYKLKYVCTYVRTSLTSVVSWSKRWVYLVLPERPKFFT